jgi:hypothetical protein
MGHGTCLAGLGIVRMHTFDDGTGPALYALTCNDVRRWTQSGWVAANQGVVGWPTGFRSFDEGAGESLYIFTGAFNDYRMLRWEAGSWVASTPGLYTVYGTGPTTGETPVLSIAEASGPVLYGREAGHVDDRWIIRWDGSQWQRIGYAPNARLIALDDGSGPELYSVAARFIEGMPVGGLAKWDGIQWIAILQDNDRITSLREPIGGVINGVPAVYVIGRRIINGQVLPQSIYRVDMQGNITDIGLPMVNHQPNQMFELSVLHIADLGEGPNLFLGGTYAYDWNAFPLRGNIARWDGSQWHHMGVGLNGAVYHIDSMTVGQTPMLFAAGNVHTLGQAQVTGIAAWVGCPNCYANCDNSQFAPALNVDDFICFVDRFAGRDPYADCNLDGLLNVEDFLCFISHFAAGSAAGTSCP